MTTISSTYTNTLKYMPPNKRHDHYLKNKEMIDDMIKEQEQLLSEIDIVSNNTTITNNMNTVSKQFSLMEYDNLLNAIQRKIYQILHDKDNIEGQIKYHSRIMFDNTMYIQSIDKYLQQSSDYINSRSGVISLNLKRSMDKAIVDKEQYINIYMNHSAILKNNEEQLINMNSMIESYKNDIDTNIINKNNMIKKYKKLEDENILNEKKNTKCLQKKINWLDSLINILSLKID